jgi:hypothetical protein
MLSIAIVTTLNTLASERQRECREKERPVWFDVVFIVVLRRDSIDRSNRDLIELIPVVV